MTANDEDRDWLEQQGFDLAVLDREEISATDSPQVPDLESYQRIVLCQSGGKDSLAMLLHLLELGVPREKIECHHHLVDGREGSTLMDWPVTEAYCEAVCHALGVELTFSWREGGLEQEMLRNGTATAPVWIPDGTGYRVLGGNGPAGVRRKFPQVTADLSRRWCSPATKIDVFARYLANNPKFLNSRTLVLTGERAEESASRAHYKDFEPHRCDTRDSKRVPRLIDLWRAVHKWSERQVWAIIQRWKVLPHPAYFLGWGRMSCRACVFGSKNQWASVRAISPDQFGKIASYEKEFRITIHRTQSVIERADAGTPYNFDPKWVEIGNSREFTHPVFVDPWVLPKGAYGESCGPT